MKKLCKILAAAILSIAIACGFVLAGCGGAPYVTSIEKTSAAGNTDTFTVYYSDGTSQSFGITNGKDGANGKDGEDGAGVTVSDIYAEYLERTGEDITYTQFLQKYLSFTVDTSSAVAQCLQSALKVYTEFVEKYSLGFPRPQTYYDTNVYTGSAVIWSIDAEEDGYTYIVTNYHVVYDSAADADKNGGTQIARKIYCYLYGSEGAPVELDDADADGYTAYDYGEYAVSCEYLGGSIERDIAVIRAKTQDMKGVNADIKVVTLADEYYVGETAIAIGNPENEGISVTQGIVSVDNEYITLSIDGTKRSYRSIRMDTALYGGNSGGGLFNADGKLIGICNAGDSDDQNINYAIPLDIVRGTVENIIYFFGQSDFENGAHIITLGVTVESQNSKYVYDKTLGYGKIYEDVVIKEVTAKSIAAKLGLQSGDVIKSVTVNGTTKSVSRFFTVSDIILTMRPGDSVSVGVLREENQAITTSQYVLQTRDFAKLS